MYTRLPCPWKTLKTSRRYWAAAQQGHGWLYPREQLCVPVREAEGGAGSPQLASRFPAVLLGRDLLFPAPGFQAHGKDGSPTPASRPHLQQLLEALMAESRSPDPSDSRAGESLQGWEPPALEKFGVEAPARGLQTPASFPRSRPGAGAPGLALKRSQPAQVPTIPSAPSLESEDQPEPIQAALEDSALGHFRGMPRSQACGFCPQMERASSA